MLFIRLDHMTIKITCTGLCDISIKSERLIPYPPVSVGIYWGYSWVCETSGVPVEVASLSAFVNGSPTWVRGAWMVRGLGWATPM